MPNGVLRWGRVLAEEAPDVRVGRRCRRRSRTWKAAARRGDTNGFSSDAGVRLRIEARIGRLGRRTSPGPAARRARGGGGRRNRDHHRVRRRHGVYTIGHLCTNRLANSISDSASFFMGVLSSLVERETRELPRTALQSDSRPLHRERSLRDVRRRSDWVHSTRTSPLLLSAWRAVRPARRHCMPLSRG